MNNTKKQSTFKPILKADKQTNKTVTKEERIKQQQSSNQ